MHLGNIERSLESFLLSFEILQAESSAADVNQTNFNVKLSTNWEAAKNLGAFGLPSPLNRHWSLCASSLRDGFMHIGPSSLKNYIQ